MKKDIVYIAHPISGDVSGNLNKIGAIYRDLSLENKVIPFAPYVASIGALRDEIPTERQLGMSHNTELFKRKLFDELWVYGTSNGVLEEIDLANKYGIKVVIKQTSHI